MIDYTKSATDSLENSDQRALAEGMVVLGQMVDHHYPGSRFADSRSFGATKQSFGMQTQQGCVRVLSSLEGMNPGEPWWVRITGGIGFEIPDVRGALEWSNDRNGEITVGRYQVSVAHHGEYCAVLWEHMVWSPFFDELSRPGRPLTINYLLQATHWAYLEADERPPQLREELGGRGCPQGQKGLDWIRLNCI